MKNSNLKYQSQLIDGYVKGNAREFFIITNWIEQVVSNYHWGLNDYYEDILQDVRLKVYINLKQNRFRKDASLKTYVYRIAKYTCIDYIRKMYKQQSNVDDIIHTDDNDNALDKLINHEKETVFQTVLKEIAAMCREMLQLVFIERLSYNEISIILNIAEGTVKSRVSRCLKKAVQLKEKYWNNVGTNTTIKIKS